MAEWNLQKLQDRLYSCIDVALDGHLATRFPDSKGEAVFIRVDGYDLHDRQVQEFFVHFAGAVLQLPDYAAALAKNAYVAGISFELNLQNLRQ